MIEGITNTNVKISEINDSGLFENLATSVLRSSDPLYHSIVHTGVNPRGRAIADPVDGFCISSNDLGKKYAIAIEHTTAKRATLSTKWLKPITGDLPKALEKLRPYMELSGEYSPRIVLTCNSTPNSSLVDKVYGFGKEHSVDIDIWSGDRIAHVLDNTLDGQTIRANFFETPQSRLSTELAKKISVAQINNQQIFVTDDQLLLREFDRALPSFPQDKNKLVFIAGDSGMGKSTLCYQYARKVLEDGGISVVLSHQLLSDCETFETAINRSLREHSTALAKDQSLQEIIDIFEQKEILIWVEDVNKSDAPADLITKLNRMTDTLLSSLADNMVNDSRITILCPVQSKHLRGLSESSREAVNRRVSQLQPLDLTEARHAVKLAIKPSQQNLTNLEADRISKSLGFDPLLIGLLQDDQSSTTFAVEKIVPDYIKRCLDRCSLEHSVSIFTLKCATISIANWMLEQGEHFPILEGLHSTLGNTDTFKCIEALSADGSLFREVTHDNGQALYFRHDRIRDYLLVQAIQKIIERNIFDNKYLTDPFYVELVSQAAINERPPESFWEKIQHENPLILFCSLKLALKQNNILENELFGRCSYLVDAGLLERLCASYRLAVEWQISELTGDKNSPLIQATSVDSPAGLEARVLNGNVLAAAELCYAQEPSYNSPYRDRLIAHARGKYGQLWLDGIGASLSRIETSEHQREALLYLAGECAEVRLSVAVHQCWKNVKESSNPLSCGMLYASVSCGAGVTGFPLNEIFNHWSSLPEEHPDDDKPWLYPRYNVAEFGLSPGLRRIGNSRTIKPLLELATNEERMRHVIFLCLDKVDHPLAVTYVASYIAKIDKDIEGKENHHNHVALSHHTISRHLANSYMRLSESSKAALKLVWTETANSFHDRKRAFQLWSDSMTSEDCLALTGLQTPDLADEILIARLRFSDRNVIPELRERLLTKDCKGYWIQYIRRATASNRECFQ